MRMETLIAYSMGCFAKCFHIHIEKRKIQRFSDIFVKYGGLAVAVTKIMCINAAKKGDIAAHLKHSIDYICNESKTENGMFTGSINCLPDSAFEQMIQTKEMFGQTGKRQGYHFVISLKPGEGTKEQMYEIIRRFAEEFLGGEYEAVYSVHVDQEHLHGHLVFNSVNMVTGRKYDYKKGDWKRIIQPITNRLCEEYGLSIVPAEYSKNPVNMNRREWEKEQSWSEFIDGDMKYCRSRAESFDEFLFLMEELGYEIKVGEHIAVKAEGMKRNRRLDTIDKEFTKENLTDYFEGGRQNGEYVSPQVYGNGVALLYKPKNEYQSRFYGKLYRMQVVQKYRFQYKYVRYKEDLQRMRELQEEYLFICRKDITNIADVIHAGIRAEEKVKEIDAQKKELYQAHARQKYQYEKDGDREVFLWQEAEYREKLAELKEDRKEAKKEYAMSQKCVKEKLYGYLGIPLDMDIENVYEMVLPEYREKEKDIPMEESYEKTIPGTVENEVSLSAKSELYSEASVPEKIISEKEIDSVFTESRIEAADEIWDNSADRDMVSEIASSEENVLYDENVSPAKLYRYKCEKAETDKEETGRDEIKSEKPVLSKAWYESLTDMEKIEWLGISGCDLQTEIHIFLEKMVAIGYADKNSEEMLEEFMRLESEFQAERQDKKAMPKFVR